jgi:methyl-accepting chemotaxis protein
MCLKARTVNQIFFPIQKQLAPAPVSKNLCPMMPWPRFFNGGNCMSSIQTERLINRTRYVFAAMFMVVALSSYIQKSTPYTWGGILGTSAIFLILAITNQIFLYKKRISVPLIYISATLEITLIFILKFVMHFDERVGYGMTIKEPATFTVYYLFIIMSALRFNKKLNIYLGVYSIFTYVILLVLAIGDGGMYITSDVTKMFDKDTIRLASEIPKIIFIGAFVFFIGKMADFTTGNMKQLEEAELTATANFAELKKIFEAVERTALDLSEKSNELTEYSNKIDTVLGEHGALMQEVKTIANDFTSSIEEIRGKSSFQFKTVEENFSKIREISALMEKINSDSSSQGEKADHALQLAEINEQNIVRTISAITDMKENSKKIEEISKTISEIADKTNLLSLNAAIESARAGEHGKGFAVVADEISKLATMSIDSSKEIATIIKNTVTTIENSSSMIGALARNLTEIISFVKDNSIFMTNLNEKTLNEFNETKILYSSSVEVDGAAKDVLDLADRQSNFVKTIEEWYHNMSRLGGVVSGSLRDLQSLSLSLKDRSAEMNSILSRK